MEMVQVNKNLNLLIEGLTKVDKSNRFQTKLILIQETLEKSELTLKASSPQGCPHTSSVKYPGVD